MSDSLQPHGLWLPGFSIHGIFQVKILEWVAVPFSKGSSQPRDQTQVSRIARKWFASEPPGIHELIIYSYYDLYLDKEVKRNKHMIRMNNNSVIG